LLLQQCSKGSEQGGQSLKQGFVLLLWQGCACCHAELCLECDHLQHNHF